MLHQQEIYADIADIGEAGEAEDIEASELQTQATISQILWLKILEWHLEIGAKYVFLVIEAMYNMQQGERASLLISIRL